MSTRYAITGAALANCLGADNETVFERGFAGTDAFSPSNAFFEFPFSTVLGMVTFQPSDEDRLDCTPTRLANVALASVRQLRPAVRAAVDRWGAKRIAYVFASSTGGLEHTERALAPDPRMPSESYQYADHGIDATTAAIMRQLGVEGVNMAISTACSSSFKALASAIRLIDHGLADAVVIGSADSLCRTTVFGFHSLGLVAPTATQPFARDRCGITLGEGSAFIVLERNAEPTKQHAIAWVAGMGAASDAFHHTSPHPEGLGGQLCMRQALDRAGMTPNQISLVSAHGTGTKLNDAAEAIAVARVFERPVPLTATKSLTGHTLGSAGLTSLILAVESLRRQEIPATLRAAPVDETLGVAVVDKRTPARIDSVIVNAFGFGGSNASVVVSRGELEVTLRPIQILGASFFSTHHATALDAIAGRERAFTPPAFGMLVGRARRFTSLVTQMHVEVCGAVQSMLGGEQPSAVFATCHGEIQTAETLIADFRNSAIVSSARFALSVHNTPSGLYSVATGSNAPSTTVTGANAIAAGWLEAALTALEAGHTVLLSIADEPVPAIFQGPTQPVGVAAAFLLAPASDGRRVELAVTPRTEPDDGDIDPVHVLARAAEAATRDDRTTIKLGPVQPGATLELRFVSQDARR